MRFRFQDKIDSIPDALTRFNPQKEGQRTLVFKYSPKDQAIAEILNAVQQQQNPIIDITTDESDLEDIFLQITQK